MDVRRVAVIGAGTMGRGIAYISALAKLDVELVEAAPDVLVDSLRKIEATADEGIKRGKLTAAEKEAVLRRIRPGADARLAVRDVDLVIEAIPEDLELKRRLFRDLDAAAPPSAILATNTSSLSVTGIASATRKPERVVGMHFFNPPHVLRLLEVVKGDATNPATVEAATAVARRMGKEPIVVRDSPGFASSRLGLALGLEAIRMLEAGVASAEDIDKAMELGYNHPMGPLKLTDLVGLDIRLAIAEHLHKTLKSEVFRPPELLREMVREGRLGRKTGRGFYPHTGPA